MVFHEQQAAALCGRHAVNNLLQGPYVTEVDLAAIAEELDAAERQLMLANGAETADALRFMAEDSGNVDNSGNFSVSVLREALARAARAELIQDSAEVERVLADPSRAEALLLNQDHHWLALRRLPSGAAGDTSTEAWFNLNSVLARPEVVRPLYLEMFLLELRAKGYSIFVVRVPGGRLPAPQLGRVATDGPICRWYVAQALVAESASGQSGAAAARKAAAQNAKASAAADPEFERALRASLSGMDDDSAGAGGGRAMSEEEQVRLALAESVRSAAGGGGGGGGGGDGGGGGGGHGWGAGHSLAARPSSSSTGAEPEVVDVDGEDAALAAAIAMSVAESQPPAESQEEAIARLRASLSAEPAAESAAETARVVIRMPPAGSGAAPRSSKQRRFLLSEPLASVFIFAELSWRELGGKPGAFSLEAVQPRRVFVAPSSETVASAGLAPSCSLALRLL